MKRYTVLFILLSLILSGCSVEKNEVISRANSSVVTDSIHLVVTEQYDGGEDLIQRIEYNKFTHTTIVYDYHWSSDGWGKMCVDTTITTIGADGKITQSTDDMSE